MREQLQLFEPQTKTYREQGYWVVTANHGEERAAEVDRCIPSLNLTSKYLHVIPMPVYTYKYHVY